MTPPRLAPLLLVAALAVSACSTSAAPPAAQASTPPTPSATTLATPPSPAAVGTVAPVLTLSGELVAAAPRPVVVPPCGAISGGLHVELALDVAGVEYRLVMETPDYNGPGSYPAPPARVSIHRAAPDGAPRLYTGVGGTLVAAQSGSSGQVDADLRGDQGSVRVSGPWSC